MTVANHSSGLITEHHDSKKLQAFGDQYIRRWSQIPTIVRLTIGEIYPPLEVEMYQFYADDFEVTHQPLLFTDYTTNSIKEEYKEAIPFALQLIGIHDVPQYGRYIDDILQYTLAKELELFPQVCFAEQPDDFSERLLIYMFRLCSTFPPEVCQKEAFTLRPPLTGILQKQWDESQQKKKTDGGWILGVLRLVITACVMGHTLTLYDEDQKIREQYRSSRMANKQLKFLFNTVRSKLMQEILNRFHQVMRDRTSTNRWTYVFFTMLGLAFTLEMTQRSIYVVMQSKSSQSTLSQADAFEDARSACVTIDQEFDFLMRLFHKKFKSHDLLWPSLDDDSADLPTDPSSQFMCEVRSLIEEKST